MMLLPLSLLLWISWNWINGSFSPAVCWCAVYECSAPSEATLGVVCYWSLFQSCCGKILLVFPLFMNRMPMLIVAYSIMLYFFITVSLTVGCCHRPQGLSVSGSEWRQYLVCGCFRHTDIVLIAAVSVDNTFYCIRILSNSLLNLFRQFVWWGMKTSLYHIYFLFGRPGASKMQCWLSYTMMHYIG